MVLSAPVFWLIAVSYLANGISTGGIMQSQVPHLMDIGFPLATGATVLTIVGTGSIIGKFGFGWLCDRIRANYAWAISCSLMVAAIVIFMSVKPTTPLAMMWLYAITLGLGYGGWLPTMSILTSSNFGLASYGTIFGMVTLAQSIGISVGPLIAGYMYDTMNTYHWAFVLFVAVYGVAISTALAIRRPKSLPNLKGG
jgi:MFS family permease